jgi:hypothetical protein
MELARDPSNPATLIDDDGLPMTPYAIDQLRNQRITEINLKRERFRLRRANQAKGFDEPRVGQIYFVQLDGTVSARTRGSVELPDGTRIRGIRFERNRRVEVEVVSDEEFLSIKATNPGALVVTVHGAEQILEDTALHVFETPLSEADVEELHRKNAALEEEVRTTRDDNSRLRTALAEMKAGRAAPDSPTGAPSKLAARAAARTAGETGAPTASNDFGAPAADKPAGDKK